MSQGLRRNRNFGHGVKAFQYLLRTVSVLYWLKVMAPVKKHESKYARAGVVDVAVQVERAYQRQVGVNENSRKKASKKLSSSSGRRRYVKSVGLGFRTPKEATNGRYVDNKCPFTGGVSIRGRIMRAHVLRTKKMKRAIVIRRNYLHFINKYQRYMKRHKNFTVHCSPCFDPKDGDDVIVGQCRPLSKTIRYNVIQHIPRTSQSGKKFEKH